MINVNAIQFRLVAWYTSLVALVCLLFGAAVYRDVETRLMRNIESTLSRRAHQLGTDILPRFSTRDPEALAGAIADVYSPEATDRFIRITGDNGKLIYLSGRPDSRAFNPARVPPVSKPGTRIEADEGDGGLLIFATAATLGDEEVIVEVGSMTSDVATVLHNLRTSLMLGLPLVVAIASVGGYALVRNSLRAVDRLRHKAQEITFGNLDNRLPVPRSGDSIEHLAVTLNQMLERLAEAYHQASRFSADASHELRTPLSIIRAELESLMRQADTLPAWLRGRLDSVLEETERLSSITESLFALSRLEAGEGKAREVRIDLAELARSTVDQLRLIVEEKGIDLAVEAPAQTMVQGDPARLKQVIVDLLDNAIKYTPTGGRITLRVVPEGSSAVLRVSDTGIGIPAEDLPHVFDRFYRADKVRSRQIEGAGLGLAIVKTICQAHGGSVQIESTEGSGTTCQVHIPLAA